MNKRPDIAIALAWPATLCKQAGAWYDGVMRHVGVNRNGYYQVGHAAVLLLQRGAQEAIYFDLGRYHAPVGMARVRSKHTDHELVVRTPLQWDRDAEVPLNLCSVLGEVAGNSACHGTGTMHWGAVSVHHGSALRKAEALQQRTFIPYGPFVAGGSNCSRFVNTVVRAGAPAFVPRLLLGLPWTVSPTPLLNVQATGSTGMRGRVDPSASMIWQPCI